MNSKIITTGALIAAAYGLSLESLLAESSTSDQANVTLVKKVLPEADFNSLFPNKVDFYTYDALLKAIAVYPNLCGESKTGDLETACKKELATMFAHFYHEADGLKAIDEYACDTQAKRDANAACAY